MFMRYTSVVLVLMLLGIELTFARASLAAGAQLSAPPELHWSACPDVPDTECAGLEVPVDPARLDGVQFTLRLGRARATDPARKEGVLLFIPGGPGVGIREMFGQLRALQRIDEFARRYDVVSFDPRGVGQSNPIRCDPDVVPFFQSCFAATGEFLAHLSAIDTAEDIERVRQKHLIVSPRSLSIASQPPIHGRAPMFRLRRFDREWP